MALGRRNSGMPYISAACDVQGLVDRDLIAQLGEVACGGQTGRACADDGDLVAVGLRHDRGVWTFSRCQSATKRSRRPMPTGSF